MAQTTKKDAPTPIKKKRRYTGGRGKVAVYTEELAQEICIKLVEGHTLTQACEDCGIHYFSAIRWLNSADSANYKPFFDVLHSRARKEQADNLFWRIGDLEQQILSGEVDPHAARIVIDSMKWRAGRLNRIYNDRIVLEHTGEVTQRAEIDVTERAARFASVLEAAQRRRLKSELDDEEDAVDAEVLNE